MGDVRNQDQVLRSEQDERRMTSWAVMSLRKRRCEVWAVMEDRVDTGGRGSLTWQAN